MDRNKCKAVWEVQEEAGFMMEQFLKCKEHHRFIHNLNNSVGFVL